jgi:SAM-dependent methyltransferase
MIVNLVVRIWRRLFEPFSYFAELERAVGDAETVLDVGCGYPSPIKHFRRKRRAVGVDAFEASIEKSRAEGIHDDYLKADVLEIGGKFDDRSFECVLAADVIEHLTKEDGARLLSMMEKIARRRVVVFTPNGFLHQGEAGGNPWQVHKSGWTPEEMRMRGYKVVGINGLKSLRGEFAVVKYRPEFLWQIVSDLTQILLKRFPKSAFQILCIKEIHDR